MEARGMRVFVYLFAPVTSWPGWASEGEFHRSLHHLDDGIASGPRCWARYEHLRDRAYRAAERLGWFGDTVVGPYVAGLPLPSSHGEANVMVAWRRGLDGQTFVASPVELPWLRDEPHCSWVSEE